MAAFGPAAVAVHDDGDVMGQPLRIEAGVNLGLFAVQPSGHQCAQSIPLTLLKVAYGERGCNERGHPHWSPRWVSRHGNLLRVPPLRTGDNNNQLGKHLKVSDIEGVDPLNVVSLHG